MSLMDVFFMALVGLLGVALPQLIFWVAKIEKIRTKVLALSLIGYAVVLVVLFYSYSVQAF